jgi:hypothetical protein
MNTNNKLHRTILLRIARRTMVERGGLLSDLSAEALAELAGIPASVAPGSEQVRALSGSSVGFLLTHPWKEEWSTALKAST